jgi:hypothetical protein
VPTQPAFSPAPAAPLAAAAAAIAILLQPALLAQSPTAGPYCAVTTAGSSVEIIRPQPDGADAIDDVNWFARPVPNDRGRHIIAFASHDQNYMYDLTTGRRVRIPDKSDAVATPDGRFVTVPSHYTATRTVNFYDARQLLDRLEQGRDAADVPPAFAHDDAQLTDVFYQSVGVLSRGDAATDATVYRMMFSGSRVEPRPGFRIVDYTVRTVNGQPSFSATKPMKLCPEIVDDMATPFISKDGRYVAAHDRPVAGGPGTLKIFEITATDPASQTTTCSLRADLGFAAGKADFSFDNRAIAFHISKHDYLTPFVNGGIAAPAITDVVVMQLRTEGGRIAGAGGLARVTTSDREGVGSYFPAFFPDGRLFYIANAVPKNGAGDKRFTFVVVDPSKELYVAGLFSDAARRSAAGAIGRLWRGACAPSIQDFKSDEEAAWYFLSLRPGACRALVEDRWSGDAATRASLLAACATAPGAGSSR